MSVSDITNGIVKRMIDYMAVRAVIFDMDGLLVDSEPLWQQAHRAVLARRGVHITLEDTLGMAGKGTAMVVDDWQRQFGWDPRDNTAVEQEIITLVTEWIATKGEPMPGAVETVMRCHERGLPLAVASASPAYLIEATLQRLGLAHYISVIHSGSDELCNKPFPDVYLSTARSLGVLPRACLVFEDAPVGARAAKAAGMVCVAVPGAVFHQTDFAAVADLTLSSLHDFDPQLLAL